MARQKMASEGWFLAFQLKFANVNHAVPRGNNQVIASGLDDRASRLTCLLG